MPTPKQLVLLAIVLFAGLTTAVAALAGDQSTTAPYKLSLPMVANDQPQGVLLPYASGLTQVTTLTNASDNRLFAAQRNGTVMIIEPGGIVRPEPFLDVRGLVETTGWEQGLVGLVFHPDYATNGYFYVFYSGKSATVDEAPSWLVRYTRDPVNPNRADPGSAKPILFLQQFRRIHKGGSLHFGPDGYLYVSTGESGIESNAPRSDLLLGKILRIDVNTTDGSRYHIPPDNPYFNGQSGARPEIWNLGLRNPWRFSFDRATGDMYIADVGLQTWEEVNVVPAGQNGRNFGWNCYEAMNRRPAIPDNACQAEEVYTFPDFAYSHEEGHCAIIGGFVYRGQAFRQLDGRYFYADFCSGTLWSAFRSDQGFWVSNSLGAWPEHQWTAFGEDVNGELYIAEHAGEGQIFRILAGS